MPDGRVYDGFAVLVGGMNSGFAPSIIAPTQCAFAKDLTFRDGFVKTRQPWGNLLLTFINDATESNWTGKFQGGLLYPSGFGFNGHIVSRGGRLFRIDLDNDNQVSEITPQITIVTTAVFTVPALNATVTVLVNSETVIGTGDSVKIDSGLYLVQNRATDQLLVKYLGGAAHGTVTAGTPVLGAGGTQIIEYQLNPPSFDLIYMFPAENYIIILAGQHKPIIYDGTRARQAGVDEIPPGMFGVYFNGRIWITLPDRRSFVAGDIVFGPSGTAQLDYRDAILKFTENDFLNEGGSFSVPFDAGLITAMIPLPQIDTSLGVGPLLIFTTNSVISVNAPADRTTWKNLTYPIQTFSLLDYGALGPRSTVSVNGDIWYRSTDGIRSFRVARQNMDMIGNTPMSREVQSILDYDTEDLLIYSSAMLFDNRLLMTVSPLRTDNGIVHRGLVVINNDALSSMTQKLPPGWEGIYTGLDILQVAKGRISEQERAFAYVSNGTDVELWEFFKKGYYDVFQDDSGLTRVAIQPALETRSMNFGDGTLLKALYTGELYIDEMVDRITLTIKFRPDQYPVWTTWNTISLCGTVSQCALATPGQFSCSIFKVNQRQYAARLMLPLPEDVCNPLSGRPTRWGYEFQFRIEGTGHFRIRQFRPHAKPQTDNMEGACSPEGACQTVNQCDLPWLGFNSHGS